MFHAIGLFFRFLYHFFFIDQKDGRLSHTKFFSTVGYGIWCWAFPYAVIHGSQASFELWMVFGAVVIGNHTLQTIMINKSGGSHADESATWKGKMKDNDDDDTDTPIPAPVQTAPPVPVPLPSVAPPPMVTAPVVPSVIIPDTTDLVSGGAPTHK